MEIYVFASNALTNIWAGIGARLWAVAETGDQKTVKSRLTKSQDMRIGSFGLLYCVKTHALTTPFIVYSKAVDRPIDNVWPGRWVLPFHILPLGTPDRQLTTEDAKKFLPIFKSSGETNFGKIFYVQAVTAFSPTKIGLDDWEELIKRLATSLPISNV